MVRRSKRRNPSGASGNQPSPRRGEKTKQSKVSQAKETDPKGAKQTKLSFSAIEPARKAVPGTPNGTAMVTAITPEPTAAAKRLVHPSPPTTPDRHPPSNAPTTTTNNNNANEVDKTTTTNEADKKPAAITTKKKPPQSPKSIISTTNSKKTPKTNKKVTHSDEPTTKSTKTSKTKDKPTKIPTALQKPSATYRDIRFNGMIETPPSENPYQDFLTLLKAYYAIIQDTLGKDIYLAAWDSEQEQFFPPIKRPTKLPASRESLGIYLGTYVNPKQEGSKIFLNLRLLTFKTHPIPLERFGIELSDNFASSKNPMSIYRQPKPCQAARSECVGWMMYSCKSINSSTFVPALKKTLNIPDDVAVGVQYRTILMDNGRKPAYDKDNPPAAALHLDIDERFALVYQGRAASLWRKSSKQRLPNGIQLRLVPCFSSAIGKSMTEVQSSDAKTLRERQFYFVKEHLRVLPAYFFISQLDTPLSTENPMTLRRAMMSRAPANKPSQRLLHNIDAAWNQPAKYTITTVVGREVEANRFLVNMIPEFLHTFGKDATKWFTGSGLLIYKDIKWNPTKKTTSSSKEKESEEMVQEDVWELNAKWEQLKETSTLSTDRPDATALDPNASSTLNEPDPPHDPPELVDRLASDKSIASFGNVYQRDLDEEDEEAAAAKAKEATDNPPKLTGTQFEFNSEQIERDRQKTIDGPRSTGYSMSTAGKTTPGTRLKLKEAQEEIENLRIALAQQASLKKDTTYLEDHQEETHEEISENQAIGAALARTPRETLEAAIDAMEEDQHDVIHIGSSSSSSDPSEEPHSKSSKSSSDNPQDSDAMEEDIQPTTEKERDKDQDHSSADDNNSMNIDDMSDIEDITPEPGGTDRFPNQDEEEEIVFTADKPSRTTSSSASSEPTDTSDSDTTSSSSSSPSSSSSSKDSLESYNTQDLINELKKTPQHPLEKIDEISQSSDIDNTSVTASDLRRDAGHE